MEYEMIAKTFQGLEPILARELTELGAKDVQIGCRMVSFKGDKATMYRANFQTRTAVRILKPISRFQATTADEVYEQVKTIDWAQYLAERQTFSVDSVVYSEDFRNSRFVTYRVKDAIVDQFTEKGLRRPNISVATPDLRLNIHISENNCTLSLDSSGESLHRRGYRQEGLEAPLNEVLAAGMIMMTGWTGDCDFIDPMCGSGTLLIEAALIARNMAPGVFRKEYAFEKWADFDRDLFDEIYNDDSKEREFEHKILGYDIDVKAVNTARLNIKAAGLTKDIVVEAADIKDFTQPEEKALMICNPPYGERITTPDILETYHTIGTILKTQFQGNDAWILSCHEELFGALHLKPSQSIPVYNGALECEFRKYTTFEGRYDDFVKEGGEVKTEEDRQRMAEKGMPRPRPDFRQRPDDARESGERREFSRERREFNHDRRDFNGEHRDFNGDRRNRFEKPDENDESDIRSFHFCSFDHNRFMGDRPQPRHFDRDGDRPHYERKPYGRDERRDFDNRRREDGDRRQGYGRDFGHDRYNRDDRPRYNNDRSRRATPNDRRRMFGQEPENDDTENA